MICHSSTMSRLLHSPLTGVSTNQNQIPLLLLATILVSLCLFHTLEAKPHPSEWNFDLLSPVDYIIHHQEVPSSETDAIVQFMKQRPVKMPARANADDRTPEQMRWALTRSVPFSRSSSQLPGDEKSTQYSITWVTYQKTDSSQLEWRCGEESPSVVLQGTQSMAPKSSSVWIHRVSNVTFDCNGQSNKNPAADSSNSILYRVGSPSELVTPWQSFKPLKQEYPIHMAVYGDMGTVFPAGGFVTADLEEYHENKQAFDMIFHMGDLAYAGVDSRDFELEFIWNVYGRQMEPLTKQIPAVFGVGNHERYYNFAAWRSRYDRPKNGDETFYYSFDVGHFHFVSMSTEEYITPFEIGSEQWKWLDMDLHEAHARGQTIIFSGHRPMYSSDNSAHTMDKLQQHIEPLLRKYSVPLFMNGHKHCYERTAPIQDISHYSNVTMEQNVFHTSSDLRNSTMYITVGSAGAWSHEHFTEKPWSVIHRAHYGFGVMHLLNSTCLHFEMFETFHEHHGKPVDEFWVVHDG